MAGRNVWDVSQPKGRAKGTKWVWDEQPGPGVGTDREKQPDVQRPACSWTQAAGRVSELRCDRLRQPSRRHAEPVDATSANFDQFAGDEARKAHPFPWPDGEAINPSRQTGVQRVKDQRQTPTLWTGPRTEALASTPSVRPALVAKDQRQTPHCQHSLLGEARATGITHPGFYGRKPWRKPNSEVIIADL